MQISILVQNLKCGGCAKTITTKLSAIPRINGVQVNPDSSSVTFRCEDVDDALLVKNQLKAIGYPSVDEANSVFSKAKSFVSCATGKMSK